MSSYLFKVDVLGSRVPSMSSHFVVVRTACMWAFRESDRLELTAITRLCMEFERPVSRVRQPLQAAMRDTINGQCRKFSQALSHCVA